MSLKNDHIDAVKSLGIRRFQLIVCKALQREAYYCSARSENVIDIVLMEQGLHEQPEKLHQELQNALERTVDSQDQSYDAILLGYGLCSNGIAGLCGQIPIVAPRAHDCITLLLGSKEHYLQYFNTYPGVYWYSPGWIESGKQPGEQRYKKLLEYYQQKYGSDNAQYLMELEQSWIKKYNRAVYIDWGLVDSEKYKDYTKKCAEFLGWEYDELRGSSDLMQSLVDGRWDPSKFLIVEPGHKITEDITQEGIIKAQEL